MRRTTKLMAKVLGRNRVTKDQLNAVVLVGGPTRTPLVSTTIRRDLDLDARHVLDPMHVVAIGAALFASTQRLPSQLRKSTSERGLVLDLMFESMTTDPTPMLAGRTVGGSRSPEGLTISVRRRLGEWRSPETKLDARGAFSLRLAVEEGQDQHLRSRSA